MTAPWQDILSLVLVMASANAEGQIRRAEADYARCQRHNTNPSPRADDACQCGSDQTQSSQNSNNAINAANVCFHDFLLNDLE
jgi:hypothetical protein